MNYTVSSDVFSQGGGYATSLNYIGDDAIGDLATGEDLTSTNWAVCAGYECSPQNDFLSFTVSSGTSAPGTPGGTVAFGTLTTAAVATSNGTTINSIFITAESSAPGGVVLTVIDQYAAMKRTATADTIDSATATLTAGVEGYGVCVFSAAEDGASPTTFDPASPFNGTCTKTTGHSVGGLTTSPQNILTSSGVLIGGTAEILAKAAISGVTAAGSDYTDTLTFVMTATY